MEETADGSAKVSNESDIVNKDQGNTQSAGAVTIVKSGEKSYTKITPAQSQATCLSSPPKNDSQTQENRTKRLKEDPRLKHLHVPSRVRAPLLRSSSMPVCVEDGNDEEKSVDNEKSGVLLHRKIYRTGSISDYTKQKLKSTILMKTSASLVRKPSITDFEMRHIEGDADSSQSDDEEEDEERDFKFSASETGDVKLVASQVASDSKNAQKRSADSLTSSLQEASVTLSVAITST